MKKLSVFCIALLSVLSSHAQQWYVTYMPRPREVNDITIFSPDHILVTGGNRTNDSIQAAFISRSGGVDWDINLDILAAWFKSTDFIDSLNGISVGFGGRIRKTTDGGETWSSLSSPLNRDYNKIAFVNLLTGFIVGGKQDSLQTILKTTNGGQSWIVVHDQNGNWLKSVYFTDADTGVAVGDSAVILKTVDGGNTWTPVVSPIQRNFNAIWFTSSSNGVIVGGNVANDSMRTVLVTSNGGDTWTVVKDELGGWLTDLFFLNQTTGYATGQYATLLKTTDGGLSWTPQTVPTASITDHFNTVNFYDASFGIIGANTGRIFILSTVAMPEVYTLGSKDVTNTQATMVSAVNTGGHFAQYDFLFSTAADLSNAIQTVPRSVMSDSLVSVEASVSLLAANTTYYFVATAKTLAGTSYGDTLSFFTGTAPKLFQTLDATSITFSSAKLHGTVKGFVEPVTLYFQYGETPALGSQVAATPASVNNTAQHAVEATVSSLDPAKNYYFRLKGVTPSGNVYGDTKTFFTGKVYNSIETLLPTIYSDTFVGLNGVLQGFQFPAVIGFDYGIDSLEFTNRAYMVGDTTVSDSLQHYFAGNISSVIPGKIYYYRMRATTALNTYYGDTIAFFTGTGSVKLQTLNATRVEDQFAMLNGSIERFAFPVNLSFQYGTNLSFNNQIDASPLSINDSLQHDVSAYVGGLQPNTLYYYRIKAETPSGAKFFGNTRQLFTGTSYIPNWDFQEWAMDTAQVPLGWNVAGRFEQVPGHSGNYALKLYPQAIALLGYFDEQNDGPVFYGGVPINARPDSVSIYMKYFVEPGDTALVIVNLNDNGTPVGGGLIPVTGNSGGVFKRMTFAIPYSSSATPDSAAIGFTPSNPDKRGGQSSYMIVDDISFSHNSTVIQDGDFEIWYEYIHNKLLTWNYNYHLAIDSPDNGEKMVTQALFDAPGDFAAEIRNKPWNAAYIGGSISTASNFDDKWPSFPVRAKHLTLNGYYQYHPENGDTMHIELDMYNNGTLIGRSVFMEGNAVTTFTPFELLINYNYGSGSNLSPDSATLRVSSYKDLAKGNSRLLIDKVRFDGFVSFIPPSMVENRANDIELTIFPNPTASVVTICLKNEMDGTLDICNLSGRSVYKQRFTGDRITVSTSEIPDGLYIVTVVKDGKRLTNKLMIIR